MVFVEKYIHVAYMKDKQSSCSLLVMILKHFKKQYLCLSPLPRLGAYKLISGLHTQARLLGSRIKTDNQGWSKMAKGKGPKPI